MTQGQLGNRSFDSGRNAGYILIRFIACVKGPFSTMDHSDRFSSPWYHP